MENAYTGKNIHFVGVGGIGVSAIAQMVFKKGGIISGSDLHPWDEHNLPPGTYTQGHGAENLPKSTSLVVYSDAVGKENPERIAATSRGISQKSFAQMLGEITRDHTTIAVSGTHGKSTTTAILGLLMISQHSTTNVFVGAVLKEWGTNVFLGGGKYFVVEADEYREHMMELTPQTIVLTNLELDHPDYYRDTVHLLSVFSGYIRRIKPDGIVVANIDDHNIRHVLNGFAGSVVSYSITNPKADLYIKTGERNGLVLPIEIFWKGEFVIKTQTKLPGRYNVSNIAAACATFLAHKGEPSVLARVLPVFLGIGRRFELIGENSGTKIISDYAHHPTALREVFKATLEYFPNKRILFVFRPHQQERTQKLFEEYKQVIESIPDLILVEIYDTPGRESEHPISAKDLLKSETDRIAYAKDIPTAELIVRERMSQYDVIVVIGAGDADKLAAKLIA